MPIEFNPSYFAFNLASIPYLQQDQLEVRGNGGKQESGRVGVKRREAVIRAPAPGVKTHRQKHKDNPLGSNGWEWL